MRIGRGDSSGTKNVWVGGGQTKREGWGRKKPTTTTTIENNNIMTVALIPHIAFRTYLSRPRPVLDSEGRSGFTLRPKRYMYIHSHTYTFTIVVCTSYVSYVHVGRASHVTQNRLSHTVGLPATRNQLISAERRVHASIRTLIRHSGPFGSSPPPPPATARRPSTEND